MIDRAKVEKALKILEAAGYGEFTVSYSYYREDYGYSKKGEEKTDVSVLVYASASEAIGAPDRLKAVMPFCDKFKRSSYVTGEITANGITPEGIKITVATQEDVGDGRRNGQVG